MGDAYTGIIGYYVLHLNCEEGNQHPRMGDGAMPWEFTGPSESACNQQARQNGWLLDLQNQRCWCPRHREGGRKIVNADRKVLK